MLCWYINKTSSFLMKVVTENGSERNAYYEHSYVHLAYCKRNKIVPFNSFHYYCLFCEALTYCGGFLLVILLLLPLHQRSR